MSDTTTITPEERARIRAIASNTGMLSYRDGIHDILTNLLTALEAVEKALLKEEVYSEELESQLQDAESEYNANWAVQALSRLGALLDVSDLCAATGDNLDDFVFDEVVDLKKRAEQAEAENARLTAERDWLAERCVTSLDECPRTSYYQDSGKNPPWCSYHFDTHDGFCCSGGADDCWTEAARRTVGEG